MSGVARVIVCCVSGLIQAQLDETVDALEAAQRLSEQLDHKEEMIAALREEGMVWVCVSVCVCVCVCVCVQ